MTNVAVTQRQAQAACICQKLFLQTPGPSSPCFLVKAANCAFSKVSVFDPMQTSACPIPPLLVHAKLAINKLTARLPDATQTPEPSSGTRGHS